MPLDLGPIESTVTFLAVAEYILGLEPKAVDVNIDSNYYAKVVSKNTRRNRSTDAYTRDIPYNNNVHEDAKVCIKPKVVLR